MKRRQADQIEMFSSQLKILPGRMVKLIDNFTDAEGNIVKQTQRKKKILTVANPELRGTGKGAKIRGGTGLTPGPLP